MKKKSKSQVIFEPGIGKVGLNDGQKKLVDELDMIIESGDVNKMLKHLALMRANGLIPSPRQTAKISAHVFKTRDKNLCLEFGIAFGGLGAFTKELGEIVAEEGTPEENFDFAQYVEGADIILHGKAIKKRKEKSWWAAFVRLFPEQAKFIVRNAKSQNSAEKAASK